MTEERECEACRSRQGKFTQALSAARHTTRWGRDEPNEDSSAEHVAEACILLGNLVDAEGLQEPHWLNQFRRESKLWYDEAIVDLLSKRLNLSKNDVHRLPIEEAMKHMRTALQLMKDKANASPDTKPKAASNQKTRGRPLGKHPHDAAILEAWKRGGFRTKKELAEALGFSPRLVKRALERVRSKQRRKAAVKIGPSSPLIKPQRKK